MRYSYEFKRKCVEMYRQQGIYPETPEGIMPASFHRRVREWAAIEKNCGPEALKHKNRNKHWSVEERYELVVRVIAGESIGSRLPLGSIKAY